MPDTGGANVPALNDLLSSWSIASVSYTHLDVYKRQLETV